MNQMLSGVDRGSLVKIVALYLVVYAVLSACGAVLFPLIGAVGLAGSMITSSALGAAEQAGVNTLTDAEVAAATTGLAAMGVTAIVFGIIALIAVPVSLVAAYGLFQRKAWARQAAIIALGLDILLSLVLIPSSGLLSSIIWIAVSGFMLYLLLTDEGIKMELSR